MRGTVRVVAHQRDVPEEGGVYISIEVATEGLSAWTLTGREQQDRVQLACGRAVGWIEKGTLAKIIFPEVLVLDWPCRGCQRAVKVVVDSLREVPELASQGVLCRECSIIEEQAMSGVQTIGPRR